MIGPVPPVPIDASRHTSPTGSDGLVGPSSHPVVVRQRPAGSPQTSSWHASMDFPSNRCAQESVRVMPRRTPSRRATRAGIFGLLAFLPPKPATRSVFRFLGHAPSVTHRCCGETTVAPQIARLPPPGERTPANRGTRSARPVEGSINRPLATSDSTTISGPAPDRVRGLRPLPLCPSTLVDATSRAAGRPPFKRACPARVVADAIVRALADQHEIIRQDRMKSVDGKQPPFHVVKPVQHQTEVRRVALHLVSNHKEASISRDIVGRGVHWPSNSTFAAPVANVAPGWIGAAIIRLPLRKSSSRPLRNHFGRVPPSLDTCHLPPGPGNGCT